MKNIKDIEPTKGHVLIEVPKKETEVEGIIIAGDQKNNAPVRGTVIRVSPDGSPFAEGEEIFFRKYAMDELKFEDETLTEMTVMLVDETEVLGVVRPLEEQSENSVEEDRGLSKLGDIKLRKAVQNPEEFKREKKHGTE